jgi:hypothetical protein
VIGRTTLPTSGNDTWKRSPGGTTPCSRRVRNTKYELTASRAKPRRQPGSPKRTLATPSFTWNCQ